jgi:uncharacterized protein
MSGRAHGLIKILDDPLLFYFYTIMEFEYDPEKSQSNREKHGIDFNEARALWADERHIIVPARSSTEERYALIGRYRGNLWTCVFTLRNMNLRIISVRKARDEEKEGYDHR